MRVVIATVMFVLGSGLASAQVLPTPGGSALGMTSPLGASGQSHEKRERFLQEARAASLHMKAGVQPAAGTERIPAPDELKKHLCLV